MIEQLRKSVYAALLACSIFILPSVATAQDDDIGVTMRMVEDDQELDENFVQELQLPSSLDEPDDAEGSDLGTLAEETREDLLDIESSLSEQARESRDALDVELPGELVIEEPELDVPIVEDPELELPQLEDPDLSSPELNAPETELLDTESLNESQESLQ